MRKPGRCRPYHNPDHDRGSGRGTLQAPCLYTIARAGRLSRLGGRNVLRLTKNAATETLYGQIAHRLAT